MICDFEVLWCLYQKLDVDLAYIILNRIANYEPKRPSPLLYGMHLSHIIVKLVGSVRNEPSTGLGHTDVINKTTLGRMNYVKKNGAWLTKDARATIHQYKGSL